MNCLAKKYVYTGSNSSSKNVLKTVGSVSKIDFLMHSVPDDRHVFKSGQYTFYGKL